MKINAISTYKLTRRSFKQGYKYQDWHDDYGTYYNNITIKDGIISASIVSAICFAGTYILANEEKIKNVLKKGKEIITNNIKKTYRV